MHRSAGRRTSPRWITGRWRGSAGLGRPIYESGRTSQQMLGCWKRRSWPFFAMRSVSAKRAALVGESQLHIDTEPHAKILRQGEPPLYFGFLCNIWMAAKARSATRISVHREEESGEDVLLEEAGASVGRLCLYEGTWVCVEMGGGGASDFVACLWFFPTPERDPRSLR